MKNNKIEGTKIKRCLVLLCVMILATSTLTVATGFFFPGESEQPVVGDGEIVLIQRAGPEDISQLNELDVNILDSYNNFVLVEAKEGDVVMLEEEGFTVNTLSTRTHISLGGQLHDVSDGELERLSDGEIIRPEIEYDVGEKGPYIVHMLGPINPEWREELEREGVEIVNYIPNYAYRVRMTPERADRVSELDFVDWVGFYPPEYKIQTDIEPGIVDINLVPGAGVESVEDIIEEVPIISSVALGSRGFQIRAEIIDQETFDELARHPDVSYISEHNEVELHDEMATQIIGGGTWFYPDDWEPGDNAYRNPDLPGEYAGDAGSYMNQVGYTGDGVVVAVADTGLGDGTTPDAGHDDFTGRVIGGYTFGSGGWEDGHGHGTHCTGSVGADTYYGTGQGYGFDDYYAAQGSAPEAELFAIQIFENGGSVIPADLMEIFEVAKQEADEPAYVHSNSWGSTAGHGTYTEQSAVFDAAVRDSNRDTEENEPMVITASAGNDGDTGVPPPASAKNIITVGATENYNSETDNPEYIAGFSSRGPVDDNRVKPDVQAPGSDVYSTMPGNDYGYMSGTSMSNPAVAGAAAVVVEWYEDEYGEKPSPAMVKSLLINTANPLDGDTEGSIPNGDEGWGMVDVSKLQNPYDDPVSFLLEDQDSLLETGDVDEHIVGVENDDEPLKITLTWTDQEAPDDTGSGTALMNDLNLEVISPSGDVYQGNAFAEDAGDESTWDYTYPNTDTMSVFDDSGDGWDDTNNVQNVYIHPDELESGAYTINVEGFDITEDANNDGEINQDYALTVYNAAEGPQIDLERPEGGEYWEVGDDEDILWETDEGAGEITEIDLEYSVDGGDSWQFIEEGYEDTGEYAWTVPDQTTEEALIRATVYDDQGDTDPGVDMSDEFTITDVTPPEVSLTRPEGGEEWHAGDLEDITWISDEGDEPIVSVDIEYSVDGGDTWGYIEEGIDDTGEYTWEIPDETSSESQIRVWVYCSENTADFDSSDDFDLIGFPPEPPSNLDVEHVDYEDNLLSWDKSPGDIEDETDSDASSPSPDATLEEADSRSGPGGVADPTDPTSIDPELIGPENEDEWRWLYEGEWRPDETDDGIGLTSEGVWWGAIRMDLSDDIGLSFTDVAYYDHEEAAHYAQGYVAPDDGDAPSEDWIPTEEYTPTGAGWVELELDEPLVIEDPGDYWVVMEFDDMGDGYFPFGCIEPEVDNGGLVNMDNPHDPGSWDNLGDFGLDYTWALESRVIPMDVYFDVEIINYDGEVEPGEEVLVNYSVENLGQEQDTQDIEFYVDGELIDIEVNITLGSGDIYEGSFTWQTDEEDLGDYDLMVASEDSEDEVTVIVGDPKRVSHYNIYRADAEGGPWGEPIDEVHAEGSDSYEYFDEGACGDDPYYWYIVRAVAEDGVEEQNENAVREPEGIVSRIYFKSIIV